MTSLWDLAMFSRNPSLPNKSLMTLAPESVGVNPKEISTI